MAAVCAVTLSSCGGGSKGSGGSGSGSNDPTTQEPGDIELKYLLPEGVVRADFIISGHNVELNLHLTDVTITGDLWQAHISGEITLPSDDLTLEKEPSDSTISFTIRPCTIEQIAGEGIVLRAESTGDPQEDTEIALDMKALKIGSLKQDPVGRVGTVEMIEGTYARYRTGIIVDDVVNMDLSSYLNGAAVILTNFVIK